MTQNAFLTHGLWRFKPITSCEFALPKDNVQLWRVDLGLRKDQLSTLWQTLSLDEKRRAATFRVEDQRAQYIGARGSLRQILGAYLKTAPARVQLAYSTHGKPYLSGPPTADLTFNLSYSSHMALIGATSGRQIGVDIEATIGNIEILPLAQRCFSKAEFEALTKLPEHVQHEAFFRCWTAKEAYLKAKGMGIGYPLHHFTVGLDPSRPVSLMANNDEPEDVNRWTMTAVEVGKGYSAAVAVEGRVHSLQFFETAVVE